jgi:hypothetical protein
MTRKLQPIVIGGKPIYFEVDADPITIATPASPLDAASADGEITNTSESGVKAGRTLADPLASADLQNTLQALLEPVRMASNGKRLDEVTIELSLGIKAEVGFFVAKGETNASLKLTAKWKPEQ